MDVIERKVCIVCFGTFADSIHEFMVFVIDLKWESDQSETYDILGMSPTVRFDTSDFHRAAFCVLGSTLYAFDGYDGVYNPREGKSMYTYQLSDGISNLKLDKDMLSVGPAMHEVKVSPKAIVTPNGMILVFSRVIYVQWPNECDFELYDPEEQVWHKLPSLCPSLAVSKPDSVWIDSFTFMEDNVFFVKTDLGVFTLDIMAPNKGWKINGFRSAAGIPPHIGTSLVLIKKEICMIPYAAFDIRDYGEEDEDVFCTLVYKFPDLSTLLDNYSYISGGVALLENRVEASKVFNVCLLHSGINEETNESVLMLQVYSCNLEECRKELHKYRQNKINENSNWMERKMDIFELPATKKTMTLKIYVKEQLDGFGFCSYASIPPIHTGTKRTTRSQDYPE